MTCIRSEKLDGIVTTAKDAERIKPYTSALKGIPLIVIPIVVKWHQKEALEKRVDEWLQSTIFAKEIAKRIMTRMKFTPLRILFLTPWQFGHLKQSDAQISETMLPENAGTISGQLTGVDAGASVILRSFKNGSLVKVAEGTTTENGDFFVTPETPLERGFHQVIINKSWPVVLITDSTEAPNIQATIPAESRYLY